MNAVGWGQPTLPVNVFYCRSNKAKRGTIAADPKVFPFGTHLHVPGYGSGTVEDIGGSIRGRHIDVWFPSHAEAKRWGSRWLKVRQVR